jgi:hypothetical protein
VTQETEPEKKTIAAARTTKTRKSSARKATKRKTAKRKAPKKTAAKRKAAKRKADLITALAAGDAHKREMLRAVLGGCDSFDITRH